MSRRRRGCSGLALVLVLVLALLLTASIATFMRRAVVDAMIARHRDAVAQAEALARGGVELSLALLLEDRLHEATADFRAETLQDAWARAGELRLSEGRGTLRLRIRDGGARLNLNALLDEDGSAGENAEIFLTAFLEKVIAEMPEAADEHDYDAAALARNLIDYLDADETSPRGDLEDDYYQKQDPPYRATNRALLSVAELGLVKDFDGPLVAAVTPYVTVFPYSGGTGINPNTAPPHVLALLYSQDPLDVEGSHLATLEIVQDILDVRADAGVFCEQSYADESRGLACTGLSGLFPGEVYPAPGFTSDWFLVEAEATVGEVRRVLEVVVDRSDATAPRLLSWRLH